MTTPANFPQSKTRPIILRFHPTALPTPTNQTRLPHRPSLLRALEANKRTRVEAALGLL